MYARKSRASRSLQAIANSRTSLSAWSRPTADAKAMTLSAAGASGGLAKAVELFDRGGGVLHQGNAKDLERIEFWRTRTNR